MSVARRGVAVGEVARHVELDDGARLRAGQPLIPAGDHAAAAEHEVERDAAQVAGVEHLAGRGSHAGVVDDHRVAGLRPPRPTPGRIGARRAAVGGVHGRSACGIEPSRIVGRIGNVLALGESTCSASGRGRHRSVRRSPPESVVVAAGSASSPSLPPHARHEHGRDARQTLRGAATADRMPGDATGAVGRSAGGPARSGSADAGDDRLDRPHQLRHELVGLGDHASWLTVDSERLCAGDPLEQLAPDAAAARPDRAS